MDILIRLIVAAHGDEIKIELRHIIFMQVGLSEYFRDFTRSVRSEIERNDDIPFLDKSFFKNHRL